MTIESMIKGFGIVQRGTAAATVAGVTVTINPVTMNRTTVRCSSGRTANDDITLTSTTTILVKSSVAGNVNWEVVDFGGVV